MSLRQTKKSLEGSSMSLRESLKSLKKRPLNPYFGGFQVPLF
jgi:hypothetical protein